jgi:hypothetical protein
LAACWRAHRPGHGVLADLAEAEAAVEQQGGIGAMVEEDFAGHLRVAQLGVALHVGIERTADATAARRLATTMRSM